MLRTSTAAPAYAADHLPAVLAVAGIDIDEVAKPGENPVAERAAFVVIDCADKDYQLRTVQLALAVHAANFSTASIHMRPVKKQSKRKG